MSDRVDHEARAEDIRWLAATGESLSGAAKRLGVGIPGLEKYCTKNNLRAELELLRAREPHLPANNRAEINRRNADVRWAS